MILVGFFFLFKISVGSINEGIEHLKGFVAEMGGERLH